MSSAPVRAGSEREKAGPPPTTRILPASYITVQSFMAVGHRVPAGVELLPRAVSYQFICVLGPAWNTALVERKSVQLNHCLMLLFDASFFPEEQALKPVD